MQFYYAQSSSNSCLSKHVQLFPGPCSQTVKIKMGAYHSLTYFSQGPVNGFGDKDKEAGGGRLYLLLTHLLILVSGESIILRNQNIL